MKIISSYKVDIIKNSSQDIKNAGYDSVSHWIFGQEKPQKNGQDES